ncbi:MAG: aldo/keto reductase [Planctomycetota bacterium]
MNYRPLGRTGVKVSPIAMGSSSSGQKGPDGHRRLVAEAIDLGINFFDTANIYGDDEVRLGDAIEHYGQRERVILATKVEGPVRPDDPNGSGLSRRHIVEQCERSLRRLKTDWIDLYQFHCSHGSTIPIDEPLRAMDDLIRAGKVRYCGASHFAAWQLMESLWVSRELGLNRLACEQAVYHPLDRTIERELLPFARTYGHGVILWSPVAGGFFNGRVGREGRYRHIERVLQDRRDAGYGDDVERTRQRAHDVADVFRAIAQEKQCTATELVLAWDLAAPGVTSAIVGMKGSEQLRSAIAALDLTLTDDDHRRIDAVARPRQAVVPFNDCNGSPPLNSDWGPHLYRW